MLCYRDMTFCKFWPTCREGFDCFRALSPHIIEGAKKARLPISQYSEEPICYDGTMAGAEAPDD